MHAVSSRHVYGRASRFRMGVVRARNLVRPAAIPRWKELFIIKRRHGTHSCKLLLEFEAAMKILYFLITTHFQGYYIIRTYNVVPLCIGMCWLYLPRGRWRQRNYSFQSGPHTRNQPHQKNSLIPHPPPLHIIIMTKDLSSIMVILYTMHVVRMLPIVKL